MPYTEINGIDIHYKIQGTGAPLLFISGTGGDLRVRPGIFDSPLADHFKILAYDQRGLGQSSRPDIAITMKDYAADADSLLEAVGWTKCNVLGISFGGMVAQEFAIRFPHRIDRMVLACTSSGGAGGDSYPLHELSHLTPSERATTIIPISDKRRDERWQSENPEEFKMLVRKLTADSMTGIDEPGRKTGAARQLEARRQHDTYDRLPLLKMPVFVCGGRFDGIAKQENLEAIHSQIKNSRLELFEGGHLFYLQDPRAFEQIKLFLSGKIL